MFSPISAVNIELGIGDTIRAIKEILKHPEELRTKKQDETLTRLRQQLEIILNVVTKLENLFIEILRGFKSEEVLQNPDALKSHLNQTRIFLESRELLPYLDTAIGAVEAAAFSPRFESDGYVDMVAGLRSLHSKLQAFRRALGQSGATGPGLLELTTLCYFAERQLATNSSLTPDIFKTAQSAFASYDWQLSSDIRKIIGGIVINS